MALEVVQYLGASDPIDPVGAATMLANSHPATDTAIRPSATGVDQWLQLRGALAPAQFSWHVDIQPGLSLKPLANGNVAVVSPAEEGREGYDLIDPPAAPTSAQREAAIADTDLHLTQAEDDLERDQAPLPEDIHAVFRPSARDAQGQPVATSLSVTGSTLTMAVPHGPTSAYPIYPGLGLTSSDQVNNAGTARADSQTEDWTEADEAAFDEAAPPPPTMARPIPKRTGGDDQACLLLQPRRPTRRLLPRPQRLLRTLQCT